MQDRLPSSFFFLAVGMNKNKYPPETDDTRDDQSGLPWLHVTLGLRESYRR